MIQAEAIRARAQAEGFNLVGITRAEPSPTLEAYRQWLEAGMHGTMGYMARPDRVARREDLRVILPDAVTLIMVGRDYRTDAVDEAVLRDARRGRIASYAWHLDYHDIMTPRLEVLMDWLSEQMGTRGRVYVDTGAILERSHAQQAGMGFIGKNTLLIHRRRGSYFFLGEIISTLEVDAYDTPHRATMCGTCRRCLDACPTDAFPRPYVLDARRCISYHTIEHKGIIPRELRGQFGNWLYGCDVCQDVCPFQRFAPLSDEDAFYPRDLWTVAPLLADVLSLDEAGFQQRYGASPIGRIKRARLVRNACIAGGNSGDASLAPLLERLLRDESALVRAHAVWGLWRLAGEGCGGALRSLRAIEHDEAVLDEINACMAVM